DGHAREGAPAEAGGRGVARGEPAVGRVRSALRRRRRADGQAASGRERVLAAADDESDREAAPPESAWPRRLADDTALARSPGARPAHPAHRAVPRPDPLLRSSQPQAEHAWDAAADRWRR